MDVPAIHQWLQRRFRSEANTCVVLSPLALLGGLLVLFLTFWLAYGAAYFGQSAVDVLVSLFSNGHFKLCHTTRLWLAAGFLLALILGHLRTRPFYFSEPSEYETAYPHQERFAPGGVHGGSPAMMGLRAKASSRAVTDILFIGPRLLSGGWNLWRKSARLRAVDTAALAELLAVLADRDGRVTNEELFERFPDPSFVRTMRATELLPGVVPLELGLSLTAELRSELRGLG